MPRSTIPLTLTPESSQIHGYGYDPATQRLHIAFKSNHQRKTYEYPNSTQEEADDLAAAPSKGAWVGKFIKERAFDIMQDDPKTATEAQNGTPA